MVNKLPVVKKSISLREDVYNVAVDMADKYFQGNLSAFVGFCIMAYKDGLSTIVREEHPQAKDTIDKMEHKKSASGISFIESVLGEFE